MDVYYPILHQLCQIHSIVVRHHGVGCIQVYFQSIIIHQFQYPHKVRYLCPDLRMIFQRQCHVEAFGIIQTFPQAAGDVAEDIVPADPFDP